MFIFSFFVFNYFSVYQDLFRQGVHLEWIGAEFITQYGWMKR